MSFSKWCQDRQDATDAVLVHHCQTRRGGAKDDRMTVLHQKITELVCHLCECNDDDDAESVVIMYSRNLETV